MLITRPAKSQPSNLFPVDVAIIGGGVSGAYTAYRLMRSSPDESPVIKHLLQVSGRNRLDVKLFEASERIGGRLWSVNFPGVPYPAELGGMAFAPHQQNVYGLALKELHLSHTPFNTYTTDYIQYLRSKQLNYDDYTHNPNMIPYGLTASEKGKDPNQLISAVLLRSVPDSERLTHNILKEAQKARQEIEAGREASNIPKIEKGIRELATFLQSSKISQEARSSFSGCFLYQTGVWNVLRDLLSNEAYHLVYQASGLGTPLRNWNFYDAFLFFLTFSLLPFVRLKGGYDTLPKTLVARFEEQGGSVHLGQALHRLSLVEHNGEQLIQLLLGPPSEPIQSIVYARNVVLAMPQRALQLLNSESFIFDNHDFLANMYTVSSHPASKLFLSYDRPWWKDIPFGSGKVPNRQLIDGRSATDLPMRQCLYLPHAGGDGPALLMASYNDAPFADFWRGMLPEAATGPYTGGLENADDPDWPPPQLGVEPSLVAEIQSQLRDLHGGYDIPKPRDAIFHDWIQDPYGGAWHLWNPHVKSWEVMSSIRRPVPNANVFLCGESYSNHQGWVEGAVNTAEMVLETYFGLPRPTWVDDAYDFGP